MVREAGLTGSQLIHIIVANFVVVVAVVVCLYLIAKNYNSVKFIMKIIIMHVLFVVVVVAVPLYGRGLSKCAYLKIQFLCRNNGRGLADLAL